MFEVFDRLILLSMGEIVYQGPAANSVDWFKEIGFECPKFTVPTDYYLNITHVREREKPTE